MLRFFQRLAHARPLAVLTVLYMLFPAFILPNAEAQLKAYSGGFGPIDLKFAYSPAEVFQMVAAYGEEGRAFYRTLEFTADILYPLAYMLFFGALVTAVMQRAFPTQPMAQRLSLLAVLTFLLDMAENIGIITMLTQYPTQSETVAWVTSALTTLKWISFASLTLTLVVGLLLWLVRRFTGQPRQRPV